jgi:hypothetical protein
MPFGVVPAAVSAPEEVRPKSFALSSVEVLRLARAASKSELTALGFDTGLVQATRQNLRTRSLISS